jgi:hypothetical protein
VSDAWRLSLLRVGLALTALATLLYSAPLWRSHDLPPQVPPFGVAPPRWVDTPLFLLALTALVVLIRGGRSAAPAALTFAGAMLLLVLGDQHRWQPEVQMFVIFALGLGACSYLTTDRSSVVLALLRLYVISLYAYSGLQKLNPGFIEGVAPWLLEPALGWTRLAPYVASDETRVVLGVATALTEASVAVLLLVPRTRNAGVLLAVGIHLFLLLSWDTT